MFRVFGEHKSTNTALPLVNRHSQVRAQQPLVERCFICILIAFMYIYAREHLFYFCIIGCPFNYITLISRLQSTIIHFTVCFLCSLFLVIRINTIVLRPRRHMMCRYPVYHPPYTPELASATAAVSCPHLLHLLDLCKHIFQLTSDISSLSSARIYYSSLSYVVSCKSEYFVAINSVCRTESHITCSVSRPSLLLPLRTLLVIVCNCVIVWSLADTGTVITPMLCTIAVNFSVKTVHGEQVLQHFVGMVIFAVNVILIA